jgi:hypothetical protein
VKPPVGARQSLRIRQKRAIRLDQLADAPAHAA